MDGLMMNLIKKNFKEVENIIISSEIPRDEYNKIIQYIIYQYTHNKVDDVCLFVILYLTITKYKIINISNIINIQYLLEWHRNNNYVKRYTYKFLEPYNHLVIIEDKLLQILSIYNKSNGRLIKTKKQYTLDEFKDIIRKQIKPLINSFDDNFLGNQVDKNNKKKYDEYVELYTGEIINRLKYLVTHFGFHLLEKNSVKILSNEDFIYMKFSEKVNYYNDCIDKMKEIIFSIEQLYLIRDRILIIISNFSIDYNLLTYFE